MATGSTNAIGPVDDVPTKNSTNLVKSGGVESMLFYPLDSGLYVNLTLTWGSASGNASIYPMPKRNGYNTISFQKGMKFLVSSIGMTAGSSVTKTVYKKLTAATLTGSIDLSDRVRLPPYANGTLKAMLTSPVNAWVTGDYLRCSVQDGYFYVTWTVTNGVLSNPILSWNGTWYNTNSVYTPPTDIEMRIVNWDLTNLTLD